MDFSREYKSILKDSFIFALGTFGSKVVTFLFVPLYTSYLTTEEYGTADLLYMAVSLLFPVFTLSISEAVLRFCYQKETNKSDIYNILLQVDIAAALLNCIIAFLVSLFLPFIQQYLVYYIPLFFLCAFEGGLSNYMKGIGEIRLFAAQGVVHTAILVLSNIVLLVLLNKGLNGYFVSMLLASGASIMFMILMGRLYKVKLQVSINKDLLKKMLVYSIPMVPATMAWWVNISADKYMISWFVGVGANGLYSVAHMIPTVLTTITGLFTQSWQISAMKNYGDKDYPSLFSNVVNSVNCILAVGGVTIILICRLLATIMFKKDFFDAWECVPMLLLSAIFSVMAATLASAYMASKKTSILFYSTCIGAVVNIICNFLLIPKFGIIGAAISTSLSFFTMVLIRLVILKKRVVQIKTDNKDVLSFLIIFIEALLIVKYKDLFYPIAMVAFTMVLIINIKRTFRISKSLVDVIRHK